MGNSWCPFRMNLGTWPNKPIGLVTVSRRCFRWTWPKLLSRWNKDTNIAESWDTIKIQIHLAMRTAPTRPSCIHVPSAIVLFAICKPMLRSLVGLSTPKWTIFWTVPSSIKLVPPQQIIRTLTPEYQIWIPQNGGGLEMSGEFPCQRSPPWSVENDQESMTTDHTYVFFWGWKDYKPPTQTGSSLHHWVKSTHNNPYLTFLEDTHRFLQRWAVFKPLQLLGLSLF